MSKITMKDILIKIDSLKKIDKDIFLLCFESGYIAKNTQPGQFIHVNLLDNEVILRRPLSIHDIRGNKVYLLFRVRGKGTEVLANKQKGDLLKVLGPLGRGFSLPSQKTENILLAGGMGVAPFLFLVRKLIGCGNRNIHLILGFKTKKDMIHIKELSKLKIGIDIVTEDGSLGCKGLVTDVLKKYLAKMDLPKNIYACGPKLMFKSIYKTIKNSKDVFCQVSFEEFMGCGIGVCKACALKGKDKDYYICKDGPVFDINDIF